MYTYIHTHTYIYIYIYILQVFCKAFESTLSQIHVCSAFSLFTRDTSVGQFSLTYQRLYHLLDEVSVRTININIPCTPPQTQPRIDVWSEAQIGYPPTLTSGRACWKIHQAFVSSLMASVLAWESSSICGLLQSTKDSQVRLTSSYILYAALSSPQRPARSV